MGACCTQYCIQDEISQTNQIELSNAHFNTDHLEETEELKQSTSPQSSTAYATEPIQDIFTNLYIDRHVDCTEQTMLKDIYFLQEWYPGDIEYEYDKWSIHKPYKYKFKQHHAVSRYNTWNYEWTFETKQEIQNGIEYRCQCRERPAAPERSVKFAPLHTHTIVYDCFQSPFCINHLDPNHTFFYKRNLIIIMGHNIYKYHVKTKQWSYLQHGLPSWITYFRAYIDVEYHKLFILCSCTFCVFDLEHNKWNFIQQYHHGSETNYYRHTQIKHLFPMKMTNVHFINPYDDDEEYEQTMAYQWYDEQSDQYLRGLMVENKNENENENENESMVKLRVGHKKYGVGQESSTIYKHVHRDKLLQDDNIEFDPSLRDLLQQYEFHYITYNMQRMHDNGSMMVESDGKLDFCSGSDILYISRSKLKLYVKIVDRIYFLGTNSLFYIEKCKWQKNAWSQVKNTVELNDVTFKEPVMVLVKKRVIVIFDGDFVYCLNVFFEILVKHKKNWGDINGLSIISAVYDDVDNNIYLIFREQRKHRIVNVFEVVPLLVWRDDIVNGYIRRIEIEHDLMVPMDLCDLVIEYCEL